MRQEVEHQLWEPLARRKTGLTHLAGEQRHVQKTKDTTRTDCEQDCVREIEPVEVWLPGGVVVLHLLHGKNEVGYDQGEDCEVEWDRVPYHLQQLLKSGEQVFPFKVSAVLRSLVDHAF